MEKLNKHVNYDIRFNMWQAKDSSKQDLQTISISILAFIVLPKAKMLIPE